MPGIEDIPYLEQRIDELTSLLNNINVKPIAGEIKTYAGSILPSGYLLCDGREVSRFSYGKLFQAIGVLWGSGDGLSTFNLPDLRAASPTGAGTSIGYTTNETVSLATKYNDQLQGHFHGPYPGYSGVAHWGGGANQVWLAGSGPWNPNESRGVGNPTADATNGTPRTGLTTKGKQVGVNFIIAY